MTTYYVDTNYTGAIADGQIDTPFKTFTAALAVSTTGSDVLIKAGSIITGDYNLNCAGTTEDWRIISKYGDGDNPIFTGRLRIRTGYAINGNYTQLENLTISGSSDRGLEIGGFDNIKILNCIIQNTTSNCIEFKNETTGGYSDNVLIDNCVIQNGKGYGIWGNAGTGCIVRDTLFDNNGTTHNNCSLSPGANDSELLFENCISTNCNGGNGFGTAMNGTNQTTIYRNCTMQDNAVSGAIAHGTSSTGKVIYDRCIISENAKNGIDGGISSPVSIEIYHCTIINNNLMGINLDNIGSNKIYNNIVDGNGEGSPSTSQQIAWLKTSSTLESDYNCITEQSTGRTIYQKSTSTMRALADWKTSNSNAYDQHSIGNAPTLNTDGTLQSTSPCIDVGIVISGINDGSQIDIWGYPIFGHAPNIGASQQYGHATAEGTLTFKWKTGFNDADVSGNLNILSFDGTTDSAISYDADNNLIKLTDGTNTASKSLTCVADTEYTIQATWGLVSGSPKMAIAVDGTAGSQATFAGTFNPSDIYFGLENEELQYLKDMIVYKEATWL